MSSYHRIDPKNDNRIKTDVTYKGRRIIEQDVKAVEGEEFEKYGLREEILKALCEKRWEKPSPVQTQTIPAILSGKDVLARSKNGTGKTGAYVIPCLNQIDTSVNRIQVLILVPARELALQTSRVVKEIGQCMKITSMCCFGGQSLAEDLYRLRKGVQVLVGTSARILDIIRRGHCDLSACKYLVLDEADKMLSDNFRPVVEELLTFLPQERQIMLLSATFPTTVKNFADEHMHDPVMINTMEELTLQGVTQYYVYLEERQKVNALHTLFSKLEVNQSIIFCNSVTRVELLAKKIIDLGYSCFYIHSHMPQEDRNKVFHNFTCGAARHLVCTDLFARGVDVQSVNVVINFDLPQSSETYLHRIGRSGRFGHLGLAVNFITEKDKETFFTIEQELETEVQPFPKEVDRNLYCV